MTRAQIAQQIFEIIISTDLSQEEKDRRRRELLEASIRSSGPECVADLDAVMQLVDAMFRDWKAEQAAEMEQLKRQRKLFEDLPPDTLLKDAVRIKAAQGDAYASELLQQFNSLAHQCTGALLHAAFKAHPKFVPAPDGRAWQWLGRGEPPNTAQLLDWFQMTFPKRAKEIEASFDRRDVT
jgi:hypothetical protein